MVFEDPDTTVAPQDVARHEPRPGGPPPVADDRVIGNYQIERELGRGGMGVVYLASHQQLRDRRYAVKLLAQAVGSPAVHEQFRREVDAIAQSRHPNLLYAFDAGTHEGRPYLVTEFVEGQDLSRIVRDRGRLPVPVACEIGRQMALGLGFAHAAGIVHRDIKPQNTILQPNGQVKILDLGLACVREAADAMPAAGEPVGTPAYMPPEQWRRGDLVTPATDIYALGCTLYELLAGRLPFPREEFPTVAAQRQAHLERPAPKLSTAMPQVPGDVARLVDRCLAKDPADRPQACTELVLTLEAHAAPIVAADVLTERPPDAAAAVDSSVAFETFISEPRAADTATTRLPYLRWLAACFVVACTGLTMAYYGPRTTAAWTLRFDRLGEPTLPRGVGYAIEAARSAIFLGLVFTVAYLRFRIPLQRLVSPSLNNARVWIARVTFLAAVLAFLVVEFDRHWFVDNAAADMVTWAAARQIATTADREVIPYRWYLCYSFVQYAVVFGGLLIAPVLQFLLVDLRFARQTLALFAAAQRDERIPSEAIDRLYAVAKVFRRLVARYVDTAGVLAVGVQYEYWIGRWTLSDKGYLVEVTGMLVTAGMMVLILGYLASLYTVATEVTSTGRGRLLDHRLEQRLDQFGLAWFLRSAILSRPSGIALLSLLFLGLVAGRRVVP
jgi:hypothetical protein